MEGREWALMADEQEFGIRGNGVTWRDLHAELRQRDVEQRERDEEQQQLLFEIRDSLGDMHSALSGLPCQEHARRLQAAIDQLTDLKGHALDLRMIKKVVPTNSPRVLMVAVGVCASVLGWDWWPKLRAMIDQAAK